MLELKKLKALKLSKLSGEDYTKGQGCRSNTCFARMPNVVFVYERQLRRVCVKPKALVCAESEQASACDPDFAASVN